MNLKACNTLTMAMDLTLKEKLRRAVRTYIDLKLLKSIVNVNHLLKEEEKKKREESIRQKERERKALEEKIRREKDKGCKKCGK